MSTPAQESIEARRMMAVFVHTREEVREARDSGKPYSFGKIVSASPERFANRLAELDAGIEAAEERFKRAALLCHMTAGQQEERRTLLEAEIKTITERIPTNRHHLRAMMTESDRNVLLKSIALDETSLAAYQFDLQNL